MRKIFLAFVLILALILGGCSLTNKTPNNESENPGVDDHNKQNENIGNSDDYLMSNELLPIYNINHTKIGEIDHYGAIVQTEDSIIYTKIPEGATNAITEMDYYRYVIDTKKSIKLGTIKEWAFQSNEAVFINNHLYLLIVTGNINSKEARILKLIDFDLSTNSMGEVFSEKGGFPYNSMIGIENRLLIAKVLQNGSCVEEYNTETKERKTLISFDFNDNASTGKAIRQITADKDTISLMLLVKDTADSAKLQINVYDHSMNYLNSVDVSDISDINNELIQGITNFEYSNQILYYENFSITRFLGKHTNGKLEQLVDTNSTFSMVTETVGSKNTKLFYQSFEQGNNSLYLLDTEAATLKKTTFYADDERYYIINMSRDDNDNLLLVMYYRDPITGEKPTPRLYSIKLSDLQFTMSASW